MVKIVQLLKDQKGEWYAQGISEDVLYYPLHIVNEKKITRKNRPGEKGLLLEKDGQYYYIGEIVLDEDKNDIDYLKLPGDISLIPYGDNYAFVLKNNNIAGIAKYNIVNEQITFNYLIKLENEKLDINIDELTLYLNGMSSNSTISIKDDNGKITFKMGLKTNKKDMVDRVKLSISNNRSPEVEIAVDSLTTPINPVPQSITPLNTTKLVIGGSNAIHIKHGEFAEIKVDKKGTINIKSKTGIKIEGPGKSIMDLLNEILDLIKAHTHNSGVGPTTPPMPQDLSKIVKIMTEIKAMFKGLA